MAKRKTIKVDRVKELVNAYLQNSWDKNRDLRLGNAVVLEQILHETGNYNGFGYLTAQDMAKSELGNSVGINTTPENPAETLSYEDKFAGTDDTRRYYF